MQALVVKNQAQINKKDHLIFKIYVFLDNKIIGKVTETTRKRS